MLVAQARTCIFFVLEIDDETNYRSKASRLFRIAEQVE